MQENMVAPFLLRSEKQMFLKHLNLNFLVPGNYIYGDIDNKMV